VSAVPDMTPIKGDIAPMFSADAIRYGDLLFVSGCIPADVDGNIVAKDDLGGQMRRALENMRSVLSAAGTDFQHVLKTTVFLTDISRKPETYDVRREFFGQQPPASTMVEVTECSGGADVLIEIDAIAAIPD
jgi:2-iminobutanoate/2-iminopropanoate deaminase